MAITKLASADVYYSTSKRTLTMVSGKVNEYPAFGDIKAVAIAVKPGNYSSSNSILINDLLSVGIDVSQLAKAPEFDYRDSNGKGVWISSLLSGVPLERIIVLEADNQEDILRRFSYVYAAIERSLSESGRVNVSFALPDCFVELDDIRFITEWFYTVAHWCAMDSVFYSAELIVPTAMGALQTVFTSCYDKYNHLDMLYGEDADYATYVDQANAVVKRVRDNGIQTDLTDRQLFAIALYTTDYAFSLNRIIRNDDIFADDYLTARPAIEAIDTALMNIPPFLATVYRAEGVLSDSRKQDNQPGHKITNSAYTSTTWNMTLPFLNSMPDYPTTFSFKIAENKQPYDVNYMYLIEQFSYHTEECEVLAIRDFVYQVDFAYAENHANVDHYAIIGTEVPAARR